MKKDFSRIQMMAPQCGDISIIFDHVSDVSSGVFSDVRLDVLHQFSQRILKHTLLRTDAGCVALAYWLRKTNMQRIKDVSLARYAHEENLVLVPVGKVFHIAPTNVDTMFVYSWALSFFVGNRNVIRLSARLSPIVSNLIALLNELMNENITLKNENAFVSYERDEVTNELFSMWCSHRVVWGGNETVSALRSVRLNPHASERSFASKYSWSIIDTVAYSAIDDSAKMKLAENYFNDIFAFDQMACSSPQVIFWRGGQDAVRRTAVEFDQLLREVIIKKKRDDVMTHAVKRRNHAFSLAVDGGITFNPALSAMTSVFVESITHLSRDTCGAGFIQHSAISDWSELLAFSAEQDQTVTHFGVDVDTLRLLAHTLGSRGVDRLVPVGQALDFQVNWDGFSLIQDYIRTVEVR